MQTPTILATLERLHARATSFEEGGHVQGREALMRRILAAGDKIGNHSFDHPLDPGYGTVSWPPPTAASAPPPASSPASSARPTG